MRFPVGWQMDVGDARGSGRRRAPSGPFGPRRVSAAIALLVFSVTALRVGAQDLPPDIQADRFLLEAERQIGDGDFAAALEALDRIVALQAEHDLELAPVFWFRRAQVAMQTGLYDEVMGSATRYLQLAGREGEDYTAALELLNEAERWLAEGVFRDCAACPLMVEVPAGSFMMGSSSSERGLRDSEGPRHRVTIGSPFAVGVYEVTFDEWDACLRGGGCGDVGDEGWGRGTRPVIDVTWEDAQAYARWLSRETGRRYRLLSEAEWEYVARAGTESARYWGESADAQCRYGNGSDISMAQAIREGRLARGDSSRVDPDVRCSDGFAYTAPVGSYEPNAFGLYDVLGNVWEWTEDCRNETYVGAATDGRAWRSGNCSSRVLRGGSWGDAPVLLRSASRGRNRAGYRSSVVGFRVARTLN